MTEAQEQNQSISDKIESAPPGNFVNKDYFKEGVQVKIVDYSKGHFDNKENFHLETEDGTNVILGLSKTDRYHLVKCLGTDNKSEAKHKWFIIRAVPFKPEKDSELTPGYSLVFENV